MANGEGFKMAICLIVCFMVMAVAGLVMIGLGKIDTGQLAEIYKNLGILAAMFGVPGIISTWVASRS
jgi:hypothetical protein